MQTGESVRLTSNADDEGEVFSLPRTPSRPQSVVHSRDTCDANTVIRLMDTVDGRSVAECDQSVVITGLRQTIVLWDHQKVGVTWMRRREREGRRGGIIADEMGLGKTILGIARILDGCPSSDDRAQGWA
ncbi:hypothetical protein PISMIDRAFT_19600 [Pisolithus microcarpus 441]|uniref:SNF2 N-terminal domain-containing protein n=1 Tax=Pisolithus microcarpus 441 TaxID=765257 RepID=A0A0C9Y2F3_9AGAM|nr:hypothetical protein PISMIDRAFT_19600 [Pisolithus microcarpus 441]